MELSLVCPFPSSFPRPHSPVCSVGKVSVFTQSPWKLETLLGICNTPSSLHQQTKRARAMHGRNLPLRGVVVPARSNRDFFSRGAVHLGRDPPWNARPWLRRAISPPAQCPLDPHFPVSPALGHQRALFSEALFHLAPHAGDPLPRSPPIPGGRAG